MGLSGLLVIRYVLLDLLGVWEVLLGLLVVRIVDQLLHTGPNRNYI
jgi:hypothetical protein